MKRVPAFLLISAMTLASAFGQTVLGPCTTPAGGENFIPLFSTVGSTTHAYCVSDYGWSDAWLVTNDLSAYNPRVDGYSQTRDVLSGDDILNVQWDGFDTSVEEGFVGPSFDRGTTIPGATDSQWSIVQALAYDVGSDSVATSVVQHPDGLQMSMRAEAVGLLVNLAFTFEMVGLGMLDNVIVADLFNYHPNGSLGGDQISQGTTSYRDDDGVCDLGCIETTGNPSGPTYNGFDGRMFGDQQADLRMLGWESDSFGDAPNPETQFLWEKVIGLVYAPGTGPLAGIGPGDTGGALAWDAGSLANGGSTFSIQITKELIPFSAMSQTPEPGTVALMGLGLLGVGMVNRRRQRADSKIRNEP